MIPNETPGDLDDLEPLLDGDDLEAIEPETPVQVPEAESTLAIPAEEGLPDVMQPEPMEEPEHPAESEPSDREGGEEAVGTAATAGDADQEAAAGATATTEAGDGSGRKRGRQQRGKRELEKTTLLFLKVSQYLLIISFLPFAGPSDGWLPGMAEKFACAFGIWLAYQGQLAYAGEKAMGFMKGLVKNGTRIATLLGLFVGVLGCVPFATGFEFDWTIFREKFTLLCAGFTFAHIVGYQHGGKFNPGIASLLVVPFFAGIGGLLSWIADWATSSPLVGIIGVVGALAALGCGSQAIWTFFKALKEAKREGEAKKKANLEARRAARKAGEKVPPRKPRS